MEFNNLRRNILSNLGKKYLQTNSKKPFLLDGIRSEYSDIPKIDVEGAIHSLRDNGFVLFSKDEQSIQLTPKGLDRLQVNKDRKSNEKFVMAKELDSRNQYQEDFKRR
jgi:hypothetical protein